MEYTLPQAVLALLREEETSATPKSYFIRSGTRSTKITLIYSKRRNKDGMLNIDTSGCRLSSRAGVYHNGHSPIPAMPQHRYSNRFETYRRKIRSKSYSQSSEGSSSIDSPSTNSIPSRRPTGNLMSTGILSRCPTDTTILTGTSMDSQPIANGGGRGRDGYEFNHSSSSADEKDGHDDVDDDDDDDDGDNDDNAQDNGSTKHVSDKEEESEDDNDNDQYIALSPSCYGDEEKPLTPGREFQSSESPRPPTPNLQNYEAIMASMNVNNKNNANKNSSQSASNSNQHSPSNALVIKTPPSRQPTIEYDNWSPPILNADDNDVFHQAQARTSRDLRDQQNGVERMATNHQQNQINNNVINDNMNETDSEQTDSYQSQNQRYANSTKNYNEQQPGTSNSTPKSNSSSRRNTPNHNRVRKSKSKSRSPKGQGTPSKINKHHNTENPMNTNSNISTGTPLIQVQAPSLDQRAPFHNSQVHHQHQQNRHIQQQQVHQHQYRKEQQQVALDNSKRSIQRQKSWSNRQRR